MIKMLFSLLFLPTMLFAQVDADRVLQQSIQYHDPENQWASLDATFYFTETRPEGDDRKATIKIDNQKGNMTINRNGEEVYEITGEQAKVLKGDKEEARGLMLRNYYLYLWGLPMKLMDESTPEITFSGKATVNDQPVNVLRVAYESDTWYFSFDETTGRMLEYKFYKDEEAGKGELIKLAGEIEYDGIKIPKERSWYVLPKMKYLGTDILDRVE